MLTALTSIMQLFGVRAASSSSSSSSSTSTALQQSFARLVAALRITKSTCTVIEQSCGGTVAASILAQPGASQVFYGSSVVYNTARCQPILLNDSALYQSLLVTPVSESTRLGSMLDDLDADLYDEESVMYIRSKLHWTTQTALAYCQQLNTDYAMAESGATGPTFRPPHMKTGFAVITIAGKVQRNDANDHIHTATTTKKDDEMDPNGHKDSSNSSKFVVLRQEILHSHHADRVQNMMEFATRAAGIWTSVITERNGMDPTWMTESTIMDIPQITTPPLPMTNHTTTTTTTVTDTSNTNTTTVAATLFTTQTHSPPPVSALLTPLSTTTTTTNHTSSSPDIHTSSLWLDRVPHLRSSPTIVHQLQYESNRTKFILWYGNRILTHHQHQQPQPVSSLTSSIMDDDNDDDDDDSDKKKTSTKSLPPPHDGYNVAYMNRTDLQHLILRPQENILSTTFLGILKPLHPLPPPLEDATDKEIISDPPTTVVVDPNDLSDAAIFAVDVRVEDDDCNLAIEYNGFEHRYTFVETRSTVPLLQPLEHEIILYGTGLVEWQRRTKHCANCGSALQLFGGGTVGECPTCATKVWPRQDPSIIVIVSSRDGERILLANHKRHAHKKIYTVLAGFVEVGETFESAVAREVYEETGIRIDIASIRYVGSQPWPFPQSCMIGFIATADDVTQPIVVEPEEILRAQWFHKSDILESSKVSGPTLQRAVAEAAIRENPALSCVIPPKGVIARTLIDLWLEQGITGHNATLVSPHS
jgi:NADH pyrophosphatase NudC (nudix superfamily)/nicotinamide mononucleotide (NMN) deamidase PncC